VVERDGHSIESTTFGAAGTALQDGRVVDVQTLNGSRVTLRAPRLDDADEMFAVLTSDPEMTPRWVLSTM
jgi:RimJ/RimL family protein N-acetyltransferase